MIDLVKNQNVLVNIRYGLLELQFDSLMEYAPIDSFRFISESAPIVKIDNEYIVVDGICKLFGKRMLVTETNNDCALLTSINMLNSEDAGMLERYLSSEFRAVIEQHT